MSRERSRGSCTEAPASRKEGERDLGGRRGVTYGLGGRGKQGGESEKVGERTLEERMREHGKKSERERLGWSPSRWDLREPCVVSYHACRGRRTEHQNTGQGGQGTTGGGTNEATETWLAGGGGRVVLGSYRQSGGANSTRKTWGALVGETGTSHLIRTVTLGWPGGTVCSWELWGKDGPGSFSRSLERNLIRRWPLLP